MNLLQVEPGLLLWTIITFIIMVLILWKWAWRPIVDALDSRAERIRSDIDNAERAKDEAHELLTRHQQMIDNANQEAASIIAQGRGEAEKIKNDIIEKARAEAFSVAERSRKEIEQAKENALNELRNEIINISTDIAAKIIGKNINTQDQKSLVDDTLNEIDTVQ